MIESLKKRIVTRVSLALSLTAVKERASETLVTIRFFNDSIIDRYFSLILVCRVLYSISRSVLRPFDIHNLWCGQIAKWTTWVLVIVCVSLTIV